MSQQSIPVVASSPQSGLLRAITAAVAQVIAAIQASHQRRAKRVVRAVLGDFSTERLAAYGWSAEEIRNLKSI